MSLVVAFGCGESVPTLDEEAPIARVESPIVLRTGNSPVDEDFVVYVTRKKGDDVTKLQSCGGVLVAPNLVLTAKHCLYEYSPSVVSTSYCDATGEPQGGSTVGGYVTGTIPVGDLQVFAGQNGRQRAELSLSGPSASGKEIIDDGTTVLCSHDLAYLVLDQSIADTPIGRLRLRRPEPGMANLVLAGWGVTELQPPGNGQMTQLRLRRAGIAIGRVGPPEPLPSGSLAPRTIETGPAGCRGDSGGPLFDPAKDHAVLGLLARANNTVPEDPVSPCAPETVVNVYMTVADFPDHLRRAFAAANAEPWLEGRDAPGFLRFGELCAADLECEGGLCAGGSATTAGTCNVACAQGRSCPGGLDCGASGGCEAPAAPSSPPPVQTAAPAEEDDAVGASGSGCSVPRKTSKAGTDSTSALVAFAACVAVCRRIGRGRRFRS